MKLEDAIATTKILAQNIQKKMKLKEEIDIVICNGIDEISNAIMQSFDFILATTVETELLQKKYKLEPAFVNQTNGNIGTEFYLITNKYQYLAQLKLLKDGTVYILSKSSYSIAPVWLSKLLHDDKLPPKEKFFKEIIYDYKATNVVLPVFFRKATAAIVSKPAFDLMCDLNPKIREEIIILKQSEPLLFGLVSFDGRSKDEKRKKFITDILLDLHNDNYGKQLFDLYMVDKLVPFKDEYWQKYLNLYK
jgi:hypothetical protein